MHSIQKNIHNVIFPLDLSKVEDIAIMAKQIFMYINRKIAIRFGVLPIGDSELARHQAKYFYHLVETYGLKTALAYFQEQEVRYLY